MGIEREFVHYFTCLTDQIVMPVIPDEGFLIEALQGGVITIAGMRT